MFQRRQGNDTHDQSVRGFTLIEILVVAAIISMISSIIISSVNEGRASARDAQRQTDLNTLRTSLGVFFDNNGRYPTDYNELVNSDVLTQIPTDPTEGIRYPYATGGADFDVCVAACMEVTQKGGGSEDVCPHSGSSYNADPGNYLDNCAADKKYFISL